MHLPLNVKLKNHYLKNQLYYVTSRHVNHWHLCNISRQRLHYMASDSEILMC